MIHSSSQIVFLAIQGTQDKLSKLCRLAERHFEKSEPLLFMTANETARDFVDELLWRIPPESFIPHIATDMPRQATIAITSSRQNITEARTLVNLCAEPLFLEGDNLTIYDFEELFSKPRKQASEARYRAYREKGFTIRMES